MPTMIVKTEVEATPDVVIASLRKFAEATADVQFPHPAGTLLYMKPEQVAAIGGIEGFPALVLMTGKGSPLAKVAVQKANGDVAVTFIAPMQVAALYEVGS